MVLTIQLYWPVVVLFAPHWPISLIWLIFLRMFSISLGHGVGAPDHVESIDAIVFLVVCVRYILLCQLLHGYCVVDKLVVETFKTNQNASVTLTAVCVAPCWVLSIYDISYFLFQSILY